MVKREWGKSWGRVGCLNLPPDFRRLHFYFISSRVFTGFMLGAESLNASEKESVKCVGLTKGPMGEGEGM
jgi:hypothetical protein